jgi:hypothetical protein
MLVALASLAGTGAVLLFGSYAAYFLFQVEPRSVPIGLLWFSVALSVPVAAAVSTWRALRHGQRREALLNRVSVATIAAVGCTIAVFTVAYWASIYLAT